MSPRTSTPSPSRTLSRDQIVAAGVRIADAEGLEGVSMRRVASDLDAGVMSLYRHVKDKDELLAQMTAAILETAPYPEPAPTEWREAVRLAATLDWVIYRDHPWMILTVSSPRYYSDTHCLDWMLAALTPITTDATLARSLTLTLWSFVQGMSLHRMDAAAREIRPDFTPTEEDFATGLEAVMDGMESAAHAAHP